jgi:acetyl-CoA carboxylase carboxyltransferase component
MSWQREVDEIARTRKLALEQGGGESVARHHAKGRCTARERIEALIDKGSFQELGAGAGWPNATRMGR